MANEKNAAFPALYTSDPDALVDAIWIRLQAKFETMQAGNEVWLTIADVARQLQFSTDHVRTLIDNGVLPATDFAAPGKSRCEWRVRKSDLVNFKR